MKQISYEKWVRLNRVKQTYEYETCDECDGEGTIECECCGTIIDCEYCNGTGRYEFDLTKGYQQAYAETIKRAQMLGYLKT